MPANTPVTVVTIGCSDSGAGSGIQADLAVARRFGCYGMAVVTAVTAQNTQEVAAIAEVPDEVVIAQLDTILPDMGSSVVKTGMLSGSSLVQNTADRLEAWGVTHLVVDPQMVSMSGAPLLHPNAIPALKTELLRLATIATPTVAEAEILAGRQIASPTHAQQAAKTIAKLGPQTVLIKGGHVQGGTTDLLYHNGVFTELPGAGETSVRYGFSDVYAAAIASLLALGADVMSAIMGGKAFAEAAAAGAFELGSGDAVMNIEVPMPAIIADLLR